MTSVHAGHTQLCISSLPLRSWLSPRSHPCMLVISPVRPGLKLGSSSPTTANANGYCLPGMSFSLLAKRTFPTTTTTRPLPLRSCSFSIPTMCYLVTNPVPCFTGLGGWQVSRYWHTLKLGEKKALSSLRVAQLGYGKLGSA